ncbi:family 43 glycosylhydrolase [Roseateles sp. P5_D6]
MNTPATLPLVPRHPAVVAALGSAGTTRPTQSWGRGIDGQRLADLGDGSFRNPVVAGDHPNPAILKDGPDYYMTFSSRQSCPGAVIWHSRDLVNWVPIAAALNQPLGTGSPTDLVRHNGRYFLYLPLLRPQGVGIHVMHADSIRGPWSDPVDLELQGCLDPAHVVGEDGRRHLFVNGDRRVGLTDDGLATVGGLVHAQTARSAAPAAIAGAKLLRRGDFFYRVQAQGANALDGHVVKVARAPSIAGPWQDGPFSLIDSAADGPWRTSGPASLVEGQAGDWWMLCHGHESGYRTLGRQVLLAPIEWTRDGWPRSNGDPLDRAQRKPRGGSVLAAGLSLSDDFTHDRLGLQWTFQDATPEDLQRARYDGTGLTLRGKGTGLSDCSPLTCLAGDRSYTAEIEFELEGAAQGGLALFHDARGFVGVGIGDGQMHTYSYGQRHGWMRQAVQGQHHRLRVTNRRHLVTFEHAIGDGPWTCNPWLTEVSALHQTAAGSLASLRPALFAAGEGEVRLRRFSYNGIGPEP